MMVNVTDVVHVHASARHDHVALDFAVFVVHQDDHPAQADVLQDLLDAGERHGGSASVRCGLARLYFAGRSAFCGAAPGQRTRSSEVSDEPTCSQGPTWIVSMLRCRMRQRASSRTYSSA